MGFRELPEEGTARERGKATAPEQDWLSFPHLRLFCCHHRLSLTADIFQRPDSVCIFKTLLMAWANHILSGFLAITLIKHTHKRERGVGWGERRWSGPMPLYFPFEEGHL